MPPILGTLVKAAQGKPLFDTQQQPITPQTQPWTNAYSLTGNEVSSQPQPAQPQSPLTQQVASQEPTIDRTDSRTFPVVRVLHTATRLFNGQMEVRCRIVNESLFKIDVHQAEMLGTHADLRYPLAPRQDKEFLLYRGPCMQNNAYHDMTIEYKTESGLYFKSIHDIRYHINADRSFSVSDMGLRQPIRHIAG